MQASKKSQPRRRGGFSVSAKALVWGLAAAALAAGVRAAASGETVPGPVPAEIVAVVDGDTLAVKARIWLGQMVATDVRIARIDAPELKARCEREHTMAEQAKARLAQSVGEGPVMLRDIRYDKYGGRVLAEVETAKGENLADLMLHSGLVRPYDGGRREAWCGDGQTRR